MPASRDNALREISGSAQATVGGSVALQYVARAGLLPELSRQTYDSFPKAMREAVLNALDAEAKRVDVDFSHVGSTRQVIVSDDGVGMTMKDFTEQFMSLGGSNKFGDRSRFGRIGIGSLALLQYAEAATVETKRADSPLVIRARVQHPWNLGREDRRTRLNEMAAGTAEEVVYKGDGADHFTRITLENVSTDVWEIGQDPTAFYRLVQSLRRILPLRWSEGRLASALEALSPELVRVLREHAQQWSCPIYVHSVWERDVELHRRSFGDDGAGVEDWNGPPVPIMKTVRVPGNGTSRKLTIAGFMLSQKRVLAEWTGLTARVQDVAVEKNSFFDVTADPGFRKYISGEVWLLGDVDRERLINIDRSSFNRECADYKAVQRVMERAIVEFKSRSVQRPQRQKVAVRRELEDHIRSLLAIEKVANRALETSTDGLLPSSEARRALRNTHGIRDRLVELEADVVVGDRHDANRRYTLGLSADGMRVCATVGLGLLEPSAQVGDHQYRVEYAAGGPQDPPVILRNRPRRIIFNTGHPAHTQGDRARKYSVSLALELAYLADGDDAGAFYDQMIGFLEVL
ncbi:MAG: ATP-binding protein [Solirubrobacteraceae bacterium]